MTPTILVVDDDRMMVRTLAEILQLKGWRVSTAFDGAEAVRAVEEQPFDVVLMDVKMPVMNGVDAFKAMRRARPGVRVALMSAFAAQELLNEAIDEGVLRVMSKPVNVPSLLDFLASSVRNRRPVLLMDNDAAFLSTLADVLTLRGFETVMADGLDDALRILRERRPAAVLLHMHMGTVPARDAVLAVHEVSPEVALILYSGQPGAQRELDGALQDRLVHAYLQKPFAIDRITEVLNDVVGA